MTFTRQQLPHPFRATVRQFPPNLGGQLQDFRRNSFARPFVFTFPGQQAVKPLPLKSGYISAQGPARYPFLIADQPPNRAFFAFRQTFLQQWGNYSVAPQSFLPSLV
jgi:hypothetical protein